MRLIRKPHWLPSACLLALAAPWCAGQSASTANVIDLAQRQVTGYLAKLADLHCTETVTQQKLSGNGHVQATERAKYDYLIMMSGTGDDFRLNESRIVSTAGHDKHPQLPMLVTNGVATLLLVFHPYYRDSFKFDIGEDEMVNGQPAIPVHFTHIPGRRTPAALALRGREYPLDLAGTAWLDRRSSQVVKMEAHLLRDMSDVGLRSLEIHVEYKPVDPKVASVDVPAMAVVDVTTPRQHWRNTHVFDDYRGFSIEAEQDPNVKVRNDSASPDGAAVKEALPSTPKEKP